MVYYQISRDEFEKIIRQKLKEFKKGVIKPSLIQEFQTVNGKKHTIQIQGGDSMVSIITTHPNMDEPSIGTYYNIGSDNVKDAVDFLYERYHLIIAGIENEISLDYIKVQPRFPRNNKKIFN